MSVLLPSGTYSLRVRSGSRDPRGKPVFAPPTVVWTGPGRVRSNANGVDAALDPGAWPAADTSIPDRLVELVGPDVDGVERCWEVQAGQSSLRAGLDTDLAELSYVQLYAERSDL